LEAWWDARTRHIASMIPANSKVIEFGAGRRQLERMLPPGCTYVPSDLVDRGPGTIVADLNRRPLPDLRAVAPEVAVFGGVLEYINDVASVVKWLSDSGIATCVASFDAVPADAGVVQWFRERVRRVHFGYMCHLTEQQFQDVFREAGFFCDERQNWDKQVILRFMRGERAANGMGSKP
jgi:hypothetical protein